MICDKAQSVYHQHGQDCFTEKIEQKALICGLEEHVHTAACYETQEGETYEEAIQESVAGGLEDVFLEELIPSASEEGSGEVFLEVYDQTEEGEKEEKEEEKEEEEEEEEEEGAAPSDSIYDVNEQLWMEYLPEEEEEIPGGQGEEIIQIFDAGEKSEDEREGSTEAVQDDNHVVYVIGEDAREESLQESAPEDLVIVEETGEQEEASSQVQEEKKKKKKKKKKTEENEEKPQKDQSPGFLVFTEPSEDSLEIFENITNVEAGEEAIPLEEAVIAQPLEGEPFAESISEEPTQEFTQESVSAQDELFQEIEAEPMEEAEESEESSGLEAPLFVGEPGDEIHMMVSEEAEEEEQTEENGQTEQDLEAGSPEDLIFTVSEEDELAAAFEEDIPEQAEEPEKTEDEPFPESETSLEDQVSFEGMGEVAEDDPSMDLVAETELSMDLLAEEAEEPEKWTAGMLTFKGEHFKVSLSYGEDACLPEGAYLKVEEVAGDEEYLSYLTQARNSLGKEKIESARFFDLKIMAEEEAGNANEEGNPQDKKTKVIQPKAKVRVEITYDEPALNQGGSAAVLHFGEKVDILSLENAGEMDPWHEDALVGDLDADHFAGQEEGGVSVAFLVDRFSVFGVIYTVESYYTSASGETYKITVSYDANSKIPKNVELEVKEITEGMADYEAYVSQSAAALGEEKERICYARAFDITLKEPGTGKVFQPGKDVTVQIELLDDAWKKEQETNVVHFGDQVEVMDASLRGEAVEFETDGFSVYMVVQIVKEQIVTASDGNDYKVTVVYDSLCGIPENALLQVRELLEGEADYASYVAASAKALGKEANQLGFAHAFDISLIDPATGEHCQPGKDVKVRIELLKEDLKSGDEVSVIHFKGQAGEEADQRSEDRAVYAADLPGETERIDAAVSEEGVVEFDTYGFSIYVIIDGDNGPNARIAYTFWYYNTAVGEYEQITTQYFRYKDVHPEDGGEGASIYEPPIPGDDAESGVSIFDGWHTGSASGGTMIMNSETITIAELNNQLRAFQSTDFVEGTVFHVVAKLKEAYYITYGDVNPINILSTQLVLKAPEGETTYFSPDASVHPTRNGEDLIGWRIESEASNPEATLYEPGNSYAISGNITLIPVIENGHWLVFDDNDLVDDGHGNMVSGGASYTPAAFYMNSSREQEITVRPADPTWNGYIFNGWYQDPACTVPFAFGELLEQDTTVYAKWEPGPSAYTVIIWKQKSTNAVGVDENEKTYDFDQSFRLGVDESGEPDGSIRAGDLVYLDEQYTKIYGADGTSDDSTKQFFVFNEEKTPDYVIVKPNGDSVLNVYYDRVTMTMNFYIWKQNDGFAYNPTTAETGELYGYVENLGYVRIEKAAGSDGIHSYSYSPTYNPTTGSTGTQYGIIDGEYQQLTATAYYSFTRNQYDETTSTDANQTQYALVDGRYVVLTRNIRYAPAAGTSYIALANNEDNDNDPPKFGVYSESIIPVYYDGGTLLGIGAGWYRIQNPNAFNAGLNLYTGKVYQTLEVTASDNIYTGTLYYVSGTSVYGGGDGFNASGSGTAYGKNGNTYFPLREVPYWTYTGQNGNTVEYTNARYVRLGEKVSYTGQRYTRTGSLWSYIYTSTDAQTSGLYGVDERGGHFGLTISQQPDVYVYSYNGSTYTGTRYTQGDVTPVNYSGTLYVKNSGFSETTVDGDDRYGLDENGAYRLLQHKVTYPDVWTYTDPNTGEAKIYPSSGQRYTRTTNNNDSWQISKSFTGLYGSSLSTYGYTWPTDYNWYDYGHGPGGNADADSSHGNGTISGSRTTLKTTFEPLSGELTKAFYGKKETGLKGKIHFYLEELNGSYVVKDVIPIGLDNYNQSGFYINDKYAGFHAYRYQGKNYYNGWNDWNNVGVKQPDGYYGTWNSQTNETNPVRFYYELALQFARTSYNFNYITNNASSRIISKPVKYETSLEGYDSQSPGQKPGYYFVGWFADDAFTTRAFFDQASYDAYSGEAKVLFDKMPDHNETVYGYWRKERTRVVIVPGADDVNMGSQALAFRLDYGESVSGGLLESATRMGYVLDGWYTDENFTNRFLFSTPVISGITGVKTDYQTAVRWREARALYHDDDEAHANVRNILMLYAKWDIDTSVNGIKVVYDAGEAGKHDTMGSLLTEIPVDGLLYRANSVAVVGNPPSNYNELFVFDYWEAIGSDGSVVTMKDNEGNPITQLQTGTVFSVNLEDDEYFATTTNPETGEAILRTIMLRAKYHLSDQASYYTQITYDGNGFQRGRYPSGTVTVHGKTKNGQDQERVTLDTRINATVVLPGEDDFYLEGYELVGWSFFQGSYEQQDQLLTAHNNSNPSDPLISFGVSQEVAADQLSQGTVNTQDNKLYAMWQPKYYTVTVKQVVEDGVSPTSFTYQYRSGVENAMPSGIQSQSLVGNEQKVYTALTADSSKKLEYYDRMGHVLQIKGPTIASDADYSVRVTAYVNRDDGTREAISPQTVNGFSIYQIYGDITITYTYSLKVRVTLIKKNLTDQSNLSGSKFQLTPVEWDRESSRYLEVGAGIDFDMSGSHTASQTLLEGVYKVEETKAPVGFAAMGVTLLLTVRKTEDFILTLMDGSTLSEQIAGLSSTSGDGGGGKKHTVTLYDRPIQTITVTKQVSSSVGGNDTFAFSAQLVLEGAGLAGFDTGTEGNLEDTTNSAGLIEFSLGKEGRKEIRVPWGAQLTVTEKLPLTKGYYLREVTALSSANDTAPEKNIFSLLAQADNTLTFLNFYPVCKIVDERGETPYLSLNEALADARLLANPQMSQENPISIQMLVDYTVPSADALTLESSDHLILTTAATSGGEYNFTDTLAGKGAADQATAILSLGFDGGQLIQNAGNLTLSRVILDGNNYSGTSGSLVKNTAGSSLTVSESATLRNASSTGDGGAIYAAGPGTVLTLDGGRITGNRTSGMGGGIYAGSNVTLTLKNGAAITGNSTTGAAENGGGVYLANGGTLNLGGGGANETSTVTGNSAQGGASSNLRLPEENGENTVSVNVLSDLSSACVLRVVNAKNQGTRFGTSAAANFTSLIVSTANLAKNIAGENESLYARIDPLDAQGQSVIWYHFEPVCKLTDESGNLLYFKSADTYYPAVYDTLEGGFAAVNAGGLYTCSDGNYFEGEAASIELLCDYTLSGPVLLSGDKTVTLKTGSTTAADGYPASKTTATITRGNDFTSGSLISSAGSLTLTGITLDGNKENVTTTGDGGLISVMAGTLTLGEGASLKDSSVTGKGGAVYVGTGADLILSGGSVTGCQATHGAAVFMQTGASDNATSFTMTGGSISGNRVTGSTSSQAPAGAIEMEEGATNTKLNFAGPAYVFDNKDASEKQCNVLLNGADATVINVVGGGLNGGAKIGVWPTDGTLQEAGSSFGLTVQEGATSSLTAFVNDYYTDHVEESEQKSLFGWPKTMGSAGEIIWTSGLSVKVYKWGDALHTSSELLSSQTLSPMDGFLKSVSELATYLEGMDAQLEGRVSSEKLFFEGATITRANEAPKLSEVKFDTGWRVKLAQSGAEFEIYEANETVNLYYAQAVCKIEVEEGGVTREIPFPSLSAAVDYIEENLTTSASDPAQIQLLGDYSQPASDILTIPEGMNVALTTASTTQGTYRSNVEQATIIRTSGYEDQSMITNNGNLMLNQVNLDGGNLSGVTAKGALVSVQDGASLTIGGAVELKNSATSAEGGAVYVKTGGDLAMTGGTIKGCSASHGAAIFMETGEQENETTFTMTGGTIQGNTLTGEVSSASPAGAIELQSGAANAKLNFAGTAYVYDNKDSANKQCNVLLSENDATIINVVNEGLSNGSKIGVWPTSADRQEAGSSFGAVVQAGANTSLSAFVNDYYSDHADEGERKALFGWPKTPGSDGEIIWTCGLTMKVYQWSDEAHRSSVLLFTKMLPPTENLDKSVSELAAYLESYDQELGNRVRSDKLYFESATITKDGGEPKLKQVKFDTAWQYQLEEDGADFEGYDPGQIVNLYYEKAVCKIEVTEGGVTREIPFSSLRDAVEYIGEELTTSASNPARIQLLGDYAMPEQDTLTIPQGMNVVITTASTTERTYTSNVEQAAITRTEGYGDQSMITNRGNLTMEQVKLDGGSLSDVTASGALVKVGEGGSLTVGDGAELRNSVTSGDGGAISVESGASLSITGGSITGCSAAKGGAVSVESGASGVSMSGGSITSCQASSGSAIYLDSSALTMSGGSIQNNLGATDGAVVPAGTATVNLSGSPVIRGNKESEEASEEKNLYLGESASTAVVNVAGSGLSSEADIGIWAASEALSGSGAQFGTLAENTSSTNLDQFTNDRTGRKGTLDGTNKICWEGTELSIKASVPLAEEAGPFTITVSSTDILASNHYRVVDALTNRELGESDGYAVNNGTISFNIQANQTVKIYELSPGKTIQITESDVTNLNVTAKAGPTGGFLSKLNVTKNGSSAQTDGIELSGKMTVELTNTPVPSTLVPVTVKKVWDHYTPAEDEKISFTVLGEVDGQDPIDLIAYSDDKKTSVVNTLSKQQNGSWEATVYVPEYLGEGENKTVLFATQKSGNDIVITSNKYSIREDSLHYSTPNQLALTNNAALEENGAWYAEGSTGYDTVRVTGSGYNILTSYQGTTTSINDYKSYILTLTYSDTYISDITARQSLNDANINKINVYFESGLISLSITRDRCHDIVYNSEIWLINLYLPSRWGIQDMSTDSVKKIDYLHNDDVIATTYNQSEGISFYKTMLLETGYYRDYDVYANSSTNTRIYADGETVAVVSESTPSQEYNKQTPKLSISNTRAVCKVTDASGNLLYIDGKPALYASLEEAFEDMAATKKTGEEKKTFTSGRNSTDAVTPAKVMMLVPEYTSSAPLTVPDLDVTLTTASATDADYPFAGPDPSQPAVITRGTGNTGSLFTVNSAQTTFTLTDVTIDGGATFTDGVYSSGAVDTNGGIINASAGAVILSDHATLRNSAAKNGGGVYTSGSASLSIDGTDALITSCAAIEESGGGKGGGIYAGGSVNYSAGTLSGNSAANGSAVYVDGSTLNMTGGEITANRVDGDTGAVEVGGAAPKLNFSGDAKVYGNIYEENQVAQQRNVSLSTDPTGVIQAGTSADGNTVTGLGEGAHIGVYLTDSVFQEHGLSAQNFATSLPSATDHLSAFGNDRDRVLYGEEGENGNVKWTSYACKLTDGNGNLLYKADGSPAVYKTMEEALEALEAERSTDPGQADKSLYTTPNAGQGSAYAYDADGTNNPPVQIQMLSDYTVPAGGLLIDANRPVTIATASNHSPDGYSYHKKDENSDENRATFKLSDQTTATAPMITFATGNPVTVENIVMDGNKGGGASSTSEEGGAVKITNPPGAENPTTASFTNVQIKDISSTGKGAAVYVDDQSTLTIEGGSITGNETTDERGGAINVGSDVEKDSEGYITSVNSHGTVELKGDVEIKDNGPAVQDPTTHQTTVPQQKNIVLDVPSTEVIQTVDQGLGENAQVGVYVTNTPVINSDGDKSTVYKEYGTYNTSFSTLSTNENHAGNLSNDRNENLTGEKNSTKGEWTDLVCKLTDAEGNLLFTGPSFQEPAVFGSIKAALDAADPDAVKPLYKATKNGDEWIFTPLDTGDETSPVQIQLLQDTSLTEPITYTEVRDLTFATAPSKTNAEPDQITAMDELGDVYFYTPGQGSDPDRAKITNGQTEQSSAGGADGVESMITVNAPDATVKIKGLILDGNEKTTLGNGGAINLASGSMEVEGSVLQNFTVQGDGLAPGTGDGGKGGAIYVGSGNASGNTHDEPTLTLKDTVITGNEAVAGGGIFIEQGSGSKNPTVTLENALVVANKADGAHKIGTATDSLSGNGGGIYVSPGAVLNMENTEKPSTVAGNSSTGDGAGVYLAGAAEAGSAGARVNLGGKPDFGGTDVYTVTNGTESTSYLIQTRMNDSGRITQFYEDSAGVKHYVAMATDPTKNEVTDLGTDEEDAVYYTIKIDSQGRISKYDEDGNPLEQSGDKSIWYEKNPADGKYYRVTVNADGISQPLASDEGKAAAIRPILANYKSDLSAGTTNGGAYYPQERQDLFVEGFANPTDGSGNVTGETPATSIVITKPLSAQAGSIWVWGEETEHSQMLTQFAVFDDALLAKDDSGAVTGFDTSKISAQELAATLAAMRNARDDTSSDCGGEYLTGSTGDNPKYMYWTGGFDVRFVKRDGYGRELSGARFSLYKTYTPAQTPEGEATLSDPYQRNAAKVEISSSAGEEVEDPETHQRILKDKGLVLFEKVPTGIWYLKEDTEVEVKTNGAAGDLEGANEILWKSESIYVVLVGSKTMEITTGTGNVRTGLWAAGALLENILEEDITKQTGTGEDKADFAIFLLSSGGKAIPSIDRAELNATGISQARADLFGLAPDVKTYGIMNQAEKTAPVLAGKTDETLSPLSGGTFTIRRADRTVVEEYLVSTASGIYYVGRLPYGTYLVEETGAPSGYQLPGNYFVLQVTPEGIKNESSLNTRVVAESTQTTVYAKP